MVRPRRYPIVQPSRSALRFHNNSEIPTTTWHDVPRTLIGSAAAADQIRIRDGLVNEFPKRSHGPRIESNHVVGHATSSNDPGGRQEQRSAHNDVQVT